MRSNAPAEIERAIGLLQNTVYSFSMKVCGHREDAEDTMQEVLSRSLQHLVRFEDPSALAVWLYTVTRNRCWRMRRKGTHRARVVSLDELMPGEAELERLAEDAAMRPDNRLLKAEERRLLQEAVHGLPTQLRTVLVLHDMEELDTEQVAQILALQPGTVRVRLHRARLMLRKEFGSLARALPRRRRTGKKQARGAKGGGDGQRGAECRELFRNLSEYLDGRIEQPRCGEMGKHIEACPNCVAFIRDLRAAIDRCRALKLDCPAGAALRLRALLTREYLRLLETATREN